MSARQYFLMDKPKVGLEFSYEFRKDERSGPDTEREDTSMTYTEILDFATKGWVYHPALLVYNLELSPEWQQISEESSQAEPVKSRTFLAGYFTDATIFQYKPYTLKMFADRQTKRLHNNFAGTTKTETDSHGATLLLKYKVLPAALNYAHSESTTTGFFNSDRERDKFALNITHSRDTSNTALLASYSDSEQKTGEILTDNLDHTIDLRNTYTPAESRTLRTGLRYHDTQGSTANIKRFNASEDFRWAHAKNLVTSYKLNYDKNEFEESSSETMSYRYNLNHLLYENLRTLFNVFGSDSRFTGEKVLEYGAGLNFNYQRSIPWGMLRVNMGHEYDITERDRTARFVSVVEEPVTLTTGIITLLDNLSVDTGSIVVTSDPQGSVIPFTVYDEGDDYTIIELGNATEIRCVPGGQIDFDFTCATGAPVLVSYRYFTDPGSDLSLYVQSYGVGLNLWSVLDLYYTFSRKEQRLLDGIRPDDLIDERTNTAGAQLDWKWSLTKIDLKDRQSLSVPMKSLNISEVITLRPRDKLFVSVTGNYGRVRFKDTGEVETLTGVAADADMLVSRWGKFSVGGFWRDLSGRVEQITYSGFSTMFQWNYRIWRGSISGRFSNEEDKVIGQTFKNYEIMFKLQRLQF